MTPGAVRRIVEELGDEGHGKFVALDRKTGSYVTGSDLDALLASVLEGGTPKPRDLHIFRIGHVAAIELRFRR